MPKDGKYHLADIGIAIKSWNGEIEVLDYCCYGTIMNLIWFMTNVSDFYIECEDYEDED